MAAPVADFSGTPLRGPASLTTVFTDLSTNTPTSWLWEKSSNSGVSWANFAGTPTNQNPSEVFTKGTWSVRLTATNANGSDTKTYLDLITATDSTAAMSGGSGGPVMTTAQMMALMARWKSRWTTFR